MRHRKRRPGRTQARTRPPRRIRSGKVRRVDARVRSSLEEEGKRRARKVLRQSKVSGDRARWCGGAKTQTAQSGRAVRKRMQFPHFRANLFINKVILKYGCSCHIHSNRNVRFPILHSNSLTNNW